jgi:hypothetical protein
LVAEYWEKHAQGVASNKKHGHPVVQRINKRRRT